MGDATKVQPDLEFIRYLKTAGGDTLKKCYQCATCSVVCPLSADKKPFPRKEMIWAQWGMKERLIADADVLLCHQCGDCTAYCPRGAKPGDVLGAIRAYAYTHYGFPQGLAQLVAQPKNLPVLIAIPVMIIGLLWLLTGGYHIPDGPVDLGNFFGHGYIAGFTQSVVVIDLIFVPAFLFALYAAFRGAANMWCAMSTDLKTNPGFRPSVTTFVAEFLWPAIWETIQHKRFSQCNYNRDRVKGHLPLLLAFIGLFVVTNYAFVRKDILGLAFPSLHGPLPMWDPMKILANVSAVALIAGIAIIWSQRKQMEDEQRTRPTYYDWFLIWEIMAVGVTGLLAEFFRLADWGVLAYSAYFLHLVAVFMLFLYMPYSKFAHIVYRTAAMAFERYRNSRFVVG
ncbi:MAG: quinone-interacting membrane-bound oxidoreductase complex subunit QmoC [Thermodesulfobacteriota bacterium]